MRKLALAAALAAWTAASAFGNIEGIALDAIYVDEAFKRDVIGFYPDIQYVNHYSFEWTYPVEKGGLVAKLDGLRASTRARIESNPGNLELRLFALQLGMYLYNLDGLGKAESLTEEMDRLKADFPDDYRIHWFAGEHLGGAAMPAESMAEFGLAFASVGDRGRLPPAFWEDYAYACVLSSMYKNAMDAYEKAAILRKLIPESYAIYSSIEKSFIVPELDAAYEKEKVWKLVPRGGDYLCVSRLLGLGVPVRGDWGLQLIGYSKRKSALMIAPKLKSADGRTIGITMCLIADLSGASMDSVIASQTKGMRIVERRSESMRGKDFLVLKFDNPEVYEENGGAAGYIAFLRMKCPDKPGLGLEVPQRIDASKGGGTAYYSLKEELDRFDGTICVSILLDSCKAVFEESEALFMDLLSESVFE